MAVYNFSADHAENNMVCDVSITFVDELRDFDVEKSGKNRRRRAKWSWFAAIAEESGSDVDGAVLGTKFRNNPRSMARTEKRLKIIIMGHRDSLSYLILSCTKSNLMNCNPRPSLYSSSLFVYIIKLLFLFCSA